MLIHEWDESMKRRFTCLLCGTRLGDLGSSIGLCPECIKKRWDECRAPIKAVHAGSRELFQLPVDPPRRIDGVSCKLCFRQCRMGEDDRGYCGIRNGSAESMRKDGRLQAPVSYYFDPLPTNCVADWVCAGGTGAGHPDFAHENGPEVGFYNLAVCFESCNFNCLFCQNWQFKKGLQKDALWRPVDDLASQVDEQTSCICYFGGDPAPQLPYALRVSEAARSRHPGRILRICWETNGSMHPAYLKRMAKMSLESGGCIKMDLKAWNPHTHMALCGCDNRRVLENFAMLAKWVPLRKDPPLLVASTLLVPGYISEEEIWNLATFIAGLNPDIPYVLLAFAPQFCLDDFPTTSRAQAEACLNAAKKAGLRRVRLGNRHLVQ